MSADDFMQYEPIGLSKEALDYFGLNEQFHETDIFWGVPNGNPNLPNVYNGVYDNEGSRVVSGPAAGVKLDLPNIFEVNQTKH